MRTFITFCAVIVSLSLSVTSAFAITDPLERPNNRFGIHILFPEELEEAAELVNSSSGEWGYVVIPIQSGDRNLEKWQLFMDEAREHKLIPIIRVSTEGDYFRTDVWRMATEADILDFANFLNSLEWPTKNRYVVILNEVNRYDEWGGEPPDPERYADLLDYAVDVFKSKSTDFFIIMAGLDNASPNDGIEYVDNLSFLRRMVNHKPTLFNRLDGFASHSYPNPAFSQTPSYSAKSGISGFKNETAIINSVRSVDDIPVFITETGWDRKKISDEVIAEYFRTAYEVYWNDENVVSVSPFLLHAGPPFDQFSLIDNSEPNSIYESIQSMSKVKGEPELNAVQEEVVPQVDTTEALFSYNTLQADSSYSPYLTFYFKTLLGI